MNHGKPEPQENVTSRQAAMSECQLATGQATQVPPWTSSDSTAEENRLESLLDKKLMRRSQSKICRACLSEDCRIEQEPTEHHGDQNTDPACSKSEDADRSHQLNSIKKKRMEVEQFLDNQEKIITARQLDRLKKPYLPSQQHLPPWLLGVIEQELRLPLVPTFPTTENELTQLMAEMEMDHFDESLRQDYLTAGAQMRRVRIGVAYETYPIEKSPCLSLSSLPQLYVYEEIADCRNIDGDNSTLADQDFLESFVNLGNREPEIDGDIIIDCGVASISQSNRDIRSSQEEECDTNNAKCRGPGQISMQQLETCLNWRIDSRCSNATIKESRDERVLVTGLLRTRDVDLLPFRLLLFPGERTGMASMRMSGSFIRKSGSSRYNLRWRYEVDIPAMAVKYGHNKNTNLSTCT